MVKASPKTRVSPALGERRILRPGTPRRMREINRANVIRLLHERGPMSRADLARALQLDAKSLTNLARELLKEGILATTAHPFGAGARGRPPEGLGLCLERLVALAVEIGESAVTASAVNLQGLLLSRFTEPTKESATKAEIRRAIHKTARQALEHAAFPPLGIGLSYPGVLDRKSGTIIECAHLKGLEGSRLDTFFTGMWEGHVSYVDSTQALLLAEKAFGSARQLEDFLLLHLGVGIGCAFMSEGRLRMGQIHTAGEIGHSVVDLRGTVCWCGRRGCLETVASMETICRAAQSQRLARSWQPDPTKVADLVARGDTTATRALRRGAHAVGLVLATLVDAFGPSHVVISGESLGLGPLFIAEIEATVRRYALPSIQKDIEFLVSNLGEDAPRQGAAAAVFQTLFTA